MLRLRIANVDRLPDGGPIEFQVDKRGFDLGRAQHLDWTLPDPTRYISSKHCEVRYSGGAYWLHDVSTNGTFVNRSARRVQSPYRLAHGDQLEIGDYLISVSVEGEQAPAAEEPPEETDAAGDLWDEPADAPPPLDPRDFLAPPQKGSRAADFLNRVVDMPQPAEKSNPPTGHDAPPTPDPVAAPPSSTPPPRSAPPPAAGDPWAPTGFDRPAPAAAQPAPDSHLATDQVPFATGPSRHAAAAPAESGAQPEPGSSVPAPAAPPHSDRRAVEHEFLRQFARGANLPEDTFLEHSGDEFAYELGVLLRLISGHMMQLLSARAAAKTLARSSSRTMIQHNDNNPLKFMPSAEEAIRVMLNGSSSSYLDGRQAFERSFGDLQTHQMATFAAMQQALKELLEDLDPETIGGSAESRSLLPGLKKGKLWDAYAARWDAKAGKHEHGMIDAYLMLFAEFYDRFSRQRR